MLKPNNYEQTQTQGSYTPPSLGGHTMVLQKVEEKTTKNGAPMLVVYFDFAKDDSQPDYFMNAWKNDTRPEKKWSNQGTNYIMVNDFEGNTSRAFKTFTTSVEHSNTGFSVNWTDNSEQFCNQFKGKRVGGVFGIVKSAYNGKTTERPSLRWFASTDKVKDAKIPDPLEDKAYKQFVQNGGNVAQPQSAGTMDFMEIVDGLDELPFN